MKSPNNSFSTFAGATSKRAPKHASVSRTIVKLALAASCAVAFPAIAADPPKGNIEAAKAKVSMCIGCHGIPGYRASFPEVYSVPKIAGQNEKYIQVALRAYASGERTHPTMDAISKSLSDQDIADLAAYYSNLK
jgi:cytochrome c553